MQKEQISSEFLNARCGCMKLLLGSQAILEHARKSGHNIRFRREMSIDEGLIYLYRLRDELINLVSGGAYLQISCGCGFTSTMPDKAVENVIKTHHTLLCEGYVHVRNSAGRGRQDRPQPLTAVAEGLKNIKGGIDNG